MNRMSRLIAAGLIPAATTLPLASKADTPPQVGPAGTTLLNTCTSLDNNKNVPVFVKTGCGLASYAYGTLILYRAVKKVVQDAHPASP